MLSRYLNWFPGFFFIIFLSMTAQSVLAMVPQLQREALVALYNSTDGANWSDSTNWLAGDPCDDSWYGIYCDSSANITWIQLVDKNLAGPIPPELGNLDKLERLILGDNLLDGMIPPELSNLTNLQRMYLNDNLLEGTIPPEFANLTNLQRLYLDDNQLDGVIPPELGNLSNLQNLHLYDNQLSGSIPVELAKLSNLQSLRLSGNRLDGMIPAELGNLVNLWMLALHDNQLSASIPPELGKLVKLSIFNLSSNQLDGTIPAELGNLIDLLFLNLSGNQLSGEIPVEFDKLTKLEGLLLAGNRLSGSVPASLNKLINLNTGPVTPGLDLHWNALFTTDASLDAFLDARSESDWSATQTIAPGNIGIGTVSGDSVSLTWNPIEYTDDSGRYRVLYSEQSVGPYSEGGFSADKMASGLTVSSLKPATSYFFTVRAETDSHIDNLNDVFGDYSVEIDIATSFFAGSTSFSDDMDYLSDPLGGSLFTKADTNNGFDPTQDAAVVTIDANLTTPDVLTLTSANATWQDAADDGVFLGTSILGDFTAEVTVLSMDELAGHSVGLMVRIPADENLDAAGPGQDWVSIGVTDDMTQVTTKNTDDGVTVEVVETPAMVSNLSRPYDLAGDNISFRIQRTGSVLHNGEVLLSGDVLRLEFRVGELGEWTGADSSPLIRKDMLGEVVEVGIYQTSISEATAIVDDFSIKDERIFASGFE